jgi:hypothetical protein
MTRYILAATLFVLTLTPALAAECPAEIGKIDAALAANPKISADKLIEAEKLRDQGEDLCDAGKTDESQMALNQAKAILGIK